MPVDINLRLSDIKSLADNHLKPVDKTVERIGQLQIIGSTISLYFLEKEEILYSQTTGGLYLGLILTPETKLAPRNRKQLCKDGDDFLFGGIVGGYEGAEDYSCLSPSYDISSPDGNKYLRILELDESYNEVPPRPGLEDIKLNVKIAIYKTEASILNNYLVVTEIGVPKHPDGGLVTLYLAREIAKKDIEVL